MSKRNFLKLFILDTKEGIKKNLGYCLLILAFLYAEKEKLKTVFSLVEIKEKNIGIMDYLIFLFKGLETYSSDSGKVFEISAEWLLIQIIPVLMVISYIRRDLHQLNFQTIIKSGSRKTWWNEKCAWACEMALGFYCLIYIFGFLCCFTEDNLINYDFWREAYGINFENYTTFQWINSLVIIQVLNAIFTILCFAFITVIINESISIILNIILNVITMYYTSTFLLGNYTMILRSTDLKNSGLNIHNCYFVYIALIITVIISGNIYIEKCDLKDIMKDRG